MGRHSRRGPADNGDTADIPAPPEPSGPQQEGPGSGRRRRDVAPEGAVQAAPRPPARPDAPSVRGGHPEQREPGGGWGAGSLAEKRTGGTGSLTGKRAGGAGSLTEQRAGGAGAGSVRDESRTSSRGAATPAAGTPTVPHPRSARPRQEYVDAFDAPSARQGPQASGGGRGAATGTDAAPGTDASGGGSGSGNTVVVETAEADGGRERRGKGLTFTGIAAAAVTTVLAVVVAGQVADGHGGSGDVSSKSADGARGHDDSASRSDDRATPSRTAQAAPATYDQKMAKKYPLAADLKASGKFDAIGGSDKAPGHGQKFRYRVDVEKGLGLDGKLFAQAVQKTLNDKRSWAHDSARTFERISSGRPDFVITLASPGTTADWCAKSGLDTTEDNVSCDSAATDRVMINAYRWAQGSKTYDHVLHDSAIHPYRQMLINHEVGHRLGFNHVTCTQDGALAPVMQQQTKFLTFQGITCKPNPWVYPNG
ncbi:DUF3152 domain-containing protein [Streptomyces sp. NPDC088785]|uniref:DUF3152 domain-containing protein n=1 Tax=Streptomyces sp. NPDC088785 TaxID=3365897 RepID=UPI0037F9C1A9